MTGVQGTRWSPRMSRAARFVAKGSWEIRVSRVSGDRRQWWYRLAIAELVRKNWPGRIPKRLLSGVPAR